MTTVTPVESGPLDPQLSLGLYRRLQTLRPLDIGTVLVSLEKTNRIVVVEEGPLTGGWAGEVLARIAEPGLGDLDDAHLPGAERIAGEIERRLGSR